MLEEIWVGIDGERVKLEGEKLEQFIVERNAYLEAKAEIEAVTKNKRLVALAKLEALGLTEDDLKALGI